MFTEYSVNMLFFTTALTFPSGFSYKGMIPAGISPLYNKILMEVNFNVSIEAAVSLNFVFKTNGVYVLARNV